MSPSALWEPTSRLKISRGRNACARWEVFGCCPKVSARYPAAAWRLLMTLGYDPQKQKYVGTWIGSMMAHLWLYEGTLDAEGKVLTLNSEGPNCADEGKLATFKDVIEFPNDYQRVHSSYLLGDDGEWSRVMTTNYRRKT